MKNLIVFLCLLLATAASVSSTSAAELVNRIVAVVGTDVITLAELEEATRAEKQKIMQNYQGRAQREELFKMQKEYLDRMITDRLIQKEIDRQGLSVSDEQIDQRIEEWSKQNGLGPEDMKAYLDRQGFTLEKYREMLKSSLTVQLLLARMEKQIVVPEEKVRAYFDEHKDEFERKDRVHLKTILLRADPGVETETPDERRSKAENIRAKIEHGASFETMAVQFSEGPNAMAGGDASWIDWSALDKELQQVLDKMEPGDVSSVMQFERGGEKWYQIVKLVERETPGESSFEDAKPKIVEILSLQRRETRKEEWLKELRESYFVKVKL